MEIKIFGKEVDEIIFNVYYIPGDRGASFRFEEIHVPSKEMSYVDIDAGDMLILTRRTNQMIDADFDMRQYMKNEPDGDGMYE